MSAHHNSDDLLHYYEGDQSKLYSGILAHHSDEAASKKQIKRILVITLALTVITIAEVLVGLWAHYNGHFSKVALAFYFLGLTIFKAALIVRVFMHLGDEKKNFVTAILIPLSLFIWFIIAFISDGHFWLKMNNTQAHTKIEHVENW
jgi:cytochrome c oxidase subunit 4